MASNGIAGRVAVVAMGCSHFGERFDTSTEDLILEAYQECLSGASVSPADVDAYWLGTLSSGMSGLTLSRALGSDDKPVTRVENMCASGSEAFRNACYAVASGAYDIAMAVGVEKLKDSGYSGLLRQDPPADGTAAELSMTAPAAFSLLDPAYCARYGVHPPDEMRAAMTHVAWKNHDNGSRNPPKAQFRKSVAKETIDAAPTIAGRLGVFDCSGVSDGAACALIVSADRAHEFTDTPMYVNALSLVAGSTRGDDRPPRLRFHQLPGSGQVGQRRLRAGRHRQPRHPTLAGRGSRLLHPPDRDRVDGRPRVRRTRPGVERRAER